MFGMVVLFGLFHGLIFLPVMLSLIGPEGPESQDTLKQNNQEVYMLNKSPQSSPQHLMNGGPPAVTPPGGSKSNVVSPSHSQKST